MCRLHPVVLVLVLALAACKDEKEIEDYPCPQEGTKLTYTSFGRNFLTQNCQNCHGQPTDDRNGAPSNFDFGTLDDVHAHKNRIFARAASSNVSMPPGPDDPPSAEREKLAEWLACGAP